MITIRWLGRGMWSMTWWWKVFGVNFIAKLNSTIAQNIKCSIIYWPIHFKYMEMRVDSMRDAMRWDEWSHQNRNLYAYRHFFILFIYSTLFILHSIFSYLSISDRIMEKNKFFIFSHFQSRSFVRDYFCQSFHISYLFHVPRKFFIFGSFSFSFCALLLSSSFFSPTKILWQSPSYRVWSLLSWSHVWFRADTDKTLMYSYTKRTPYLRTIFFSPCIWRLTLGYTLGINDRAIRFMSSVELRLKKGKSQRIKKRRFNLFITRNVDDIKWKWVW